MNWISALTFGIWVSSLFAGLIVVVLFLLWAVITKDRGRIAFGVFPGVIGFNILNTATFLFTFGTLSPVARWWVDLVAIVGSQTFFVWFVWYLTLLSGRQFLASLRWAVAAVAGGLVTAAGFVFFVPQLYHLQQGLLTTTFTVNLVFALAGILVSALLKPDLGDGVDPAEIKRFLRSMVWPFLVFLPINFFDSLWTGSPHPFGYRFTSGALQCLIFSLLYLRFFFRWVRVHVNRSGTVAEINLEDAPLSDREKEVVSLVLQGRSNKEIASVLSLSSTTVRNHLSRVFPRIGVRSRFELMNRYKSRG